MSDCLKPRTLSGFQDLLPADAYHQEQILEKLKKVFESFGFAPIQTPHIELTEMLIGETGGEIGKQLFRFEDNGGRDVCLRFDLTVPLARYYVQHKNELGLPFKRYAVGSCFRGERPQQGRFREFLQCDFDILGVDCVSADAEILNVIFSGFQKLGLKNFTIKVNNRKLLNAFLKDIDLESKSVELIRLFDKKDKITNDQFVSSLEELGSNSAQIDKILNLFDTALEDLEKKSTSDEFQQAVSEIKSLFQIASELKDLSNHLKLDLTLARGFGYYTGAVFETILNDVPDVGSVAGGGRYNDLTKNFSKDDIPGVGASFGISRIIAGINQLDDYEFEAPVEVLFSNLESNSIGKVFKMASELRSFNIPTEVYPEVSKLKKQLQYANRKNIPYFLIYGEEEQEKGIITLKILETGEQIACKSVDEIRDQIFG